ncbi:hypothetical protein [Pseudonocardia sp.]|uniref:hypothetical protein n=1 Tax=Pseudonocardia sp. TaxID=60912 RepID=UPI003D0B0231
MTRPATPARPGRPDPLADLRRALRDLLATLLDRAVGVALDKVEDIAGRLDEMAARGGPNVGALVGGARSLMSGRNPIWGAFRGAFSALSPGTKAAIVAALVLALVLLPVTVVLVLLALIVLAVVAAARWSAVR